MSCSSWANAPRKERSAQPGAALSAAWGGLLPVHHDARNRADQQSGRTGHSIRDDRPAGDAGNTQRTGAALERTHLDGHRDLQATRAKRIRVSWSVHRRVLRTKARTVTSPRQPVNGYACDQLVKDPNLTPQELQNSLTEKTPG